MDSSPAYGPDRELIGTDLDRIASALSPLIVSRLELAAELAIAEVEASKGMTIRVLGLGVNVAPLVAKLIRSKVAQLLPLPPDSATPQLSAGLRRLLDLSDSDLSRVCEVAAAELGAWAGALPPTDPHALAETARPIGDLLRG